jgi:hypothetical protein
MLIAGFAWQTPASAYEVKVQADTNAAGSANKLSDVAYSIQDGDCLIRWNAIQLKADNKRMLKVYRQCDKSFEAQAGYHEDILARINKDTPIASFTSVSWGGFRYKNDDSWVIPIAVASDRSDTYHDYRENYPMARVNNINQIFVELANQTRSYQPLAKLFEDYNLSLTLEAVEKVFASKAGKLPFYEDLREKRIGKYASVIYDAGMCDFRLAPLQPK